MKIYPAIDCQNNQVVRLNQGDFNSAKTYADSPIEVALKFESMGAENLHLVDLDGARKGAHTLSDLLKNLREKTSLNIQIGGGFRSEESVRNALDVGANQVVIGSLAVTDIELTSKLLKTYGGDRITLALDCAVTKEGLKVFINGWKADSGRDLFEMIEIYKDSGLKHILCTDISKDGMEMGSNMELYRMIQENYPEIAVQVSGGVSSIEEIKSLTQLGLESCIIGRALYEKRFTLNEALDAGRLPC